jgi:hypothetical protein
VQAAPDPQLRSSAWRIPLILIIGQLAGGAAALNHLAAAPNPLQFTLPNILQTVLLFGIPFAIALALLHELIRSAIFRFPLSPDSKRRYLRSDAFTALPALATFAGAWGIQFIAPVIALTVLVYAAIKTLHVALSLSPPERQAALSSHGYLAFLFLISGLAALIYQIVWQRALFAAFGVNVESVTVIVSVFMFGLGIGSLLGGILAQRFPERAPFLFLLAELTIGAFGLASLPLIDAVTSRALHTSLSSMALATFVLLCLPTMLMGATLPILVGHLNRRYRSVGKSVGVLYCVNTIGSAAACFLTADFIFALAGARVAVFVAAAANVAVGALVAGYVSRTPDDSSPLKSSTRTAH